MEDWKPNYGGKTQYKKKNRYSQQDGDVVFRILPQPKGENGERSSDWSRYHSIHFGYKNSAGKARPFESCQVKKDKVVVVADPALDRLNALKAKLEAAHKDGDTARAAKLQTLVGFNGVYNVDNNHYMNVIGLDGNIGVLKLRYTAKQALDEEIKKLRALGVDPLSFDNGRFFVFTRTGKNRDTAFKVNVYQEQVDALTSRQLVHKVTPEILARLETDGFDLDDIAPKVTADEVAQIVAESDIETGKSPAIDRIIDSRWKKASASSSQQAPATPTPTAAAPVAAAQNPVQPAPAVTPAQAVTPKPVTPSKPLEEQSDADFFKDLGV